MANEMDESIFIVLISNFLNHHMLPICLELDKLTHGNFRFIATAELPKERAKMGYKKLNEEYHFVICAYKNKQEKRLAKALCFNCDVLIYGSAPESFYMNRLMHHKLTFRYSERVLKRPFSLKNIPKRIAKYIIRDAFTQYKSHFLLAASAYATDDFNRYGSFIGRSFKWGYFPPVIDNVTKAIHKRNDITRILWVGRLIPYKKPQIAIEVAKELANRELSFQMTIIGTGELEEDISKLVTKYKLENYVKLEGPKSNDVVREIMQHADIFLFTSNEEEGWGAVLNEAMDSGCACIAYKGIGSVPFLLKDGFNGIVYQQHSPIVIANLCEKLILECSLREKIGIQAKNTISDTWNAKIASMRLIEFAINIRNGKKKDYESGPLSYAPRIKCNAKE